MKLFDEKLERFIDIELINGMSKICGVFYKIERDHLIIEVKMNQQLILETEEYFIRFIPNRAAIKMQRHILEVVDELKLSSLFFPMEIPLNSGKKCEQNMK